MKTFLFSILTCIIISGFTSSGNKEDRKTNFGANLPLNLNVEKSFPENTEESKLENSDWYNTALSGIQKSEYNIVFDKNERIFQSPNRDNNTRFIYHKDGFTAKLRNNKIPLFDVNNKMLEEKDKNYKSLDEWNLKLVAKNISRENGDVITIDMEQHEMQAFGNTAFIENENIRFDYTNNENGMRQDFIVKSKPEGEGSLRLTIEAQTKLKMILGEDGLMFRDKDDDLKLKYSSLKCWDANGKTLNAYFENEPYVYNNSNSEIPNSNFSIVVDDKDAVYPVTIDPLSSTPSWSAQINQANANFGWSVATAGDVNGDGYSDVIIGAPLYDDGQTDEGAVFVYHGSMNGLSVTPDWTMEINQTLALFGWSVATAGDVNGDGYSDVLVGSPTFDNGQADEGKAFLFTGSSTGLSLTETWSYESNQTGANTGYSVACAGDLDNDGFSDVIIGAPFYDNGHNDEGIAQVFKSNGTTLVLLAWSSEGNQTEAHLGFSVATAGDVNGDGYSDILVGAYKYNNAFSNDGRVYAYYSTSTTYPSTPSWTKNGTQLGEYFGYSVSTAGDINGDGYSDVIIGSPLFENGQTDEGSVYVYRGSSSGLLASHNFYVEGKQTGGQLGISVSTAGDVNGDGYADIIAGGNYLDSGQTDEGKALLFLGTSAGVSSSPVIEFEGNQASAGFGFSVATAGDVNGDGLSDVIVGAYKFDDPSTDEGAAFVYYGSVNAMSQVPFLSLSGSTNVGLGVSVSTAGDVNGDGYADIIIGAPGYDNSQLNVGSAWVLNGSNTGIIIDYDKGFVEGNRAGSALGTSVSTAGDVNGDGFSDVIVGAPLYTNGQSNEGAVYIYLGSAAGLITSYHIQLESDQENAQFGCSVSSAGDVNGDGFQDVIIGSRTFDNGQSDEGAAFVYLGSPTGILQFSKKVLECNRTNSQFGECVSGAGDVNGDGYSDVIVGAPGYDSINTNAGASFVYLGSPAGISAFANRVFVNSNTDSCFGKCVSTAGDVNGDGYSDVMIAAPHYRSGSTEVGRVSIFHGSATGLSAFQNEFVEGFDADSHVGLSISACDVNGDGYSDVITGGKTINNKGAAYIYRGSPTGILPEPIWTKINDQASSYFGNSVSCAGDVNGAGSSEVIIGAYSAVGNPSGAVYGFYGGGGSFTRTRQYKPASINVVSSGMNSGTDGSIKLQQFSRSPFGRSSRRIVFDIQPNGVPFQGSIISNSTQFTTASGYVSGSGADISMDVSSLNKNKLYKWRSRVQYSMTSFPFQKFGPWKYYNNYIPTPHGNFRPRGSAGILLNLTMLIQGFYDQGSNLMVPDTVTVYLRNSSSPYNIVDTSKVPISSSGTGSVLFSNAVNATPYYIQFKHRNSIETWSMTPQQFTSSVLDYNFTTSSAQAFGNNMPQIDNSPQRFGIYSGDQDQNGQIDLLDVVNVYNAAASFANGYVNTDMNGDNNTDLSDIVITYNNSVAFVGKVTP